MSKKYKILDRETSKRFLVVVYGIDTEMISKTSKDVSNLIKTFDEAIRVKLKNARSHGYGGTKKLEFSLNLPPSSNLDGVHWIGSPESLAEYVRSSDPLVNKVLAFAKQVNDMEMASVEIAANTQFSSELASLIATDFYTEIGDIEPSPTTLPPSKAGVYVASGQLTLPFNNATIPDETVFIVGTYSVDGDDRIFYRWQDEKDWIVAGSVKLLSNVETAAVRNIAFDVALQSIIKTFPYYEEEKHSRYVSSLKYVASYKQKIIDLLERKGFVKREDGAYKKEKCVVRFSNATVNNGEKAIKVMIASTVAQKGKFK